MFPRPIGNYWRAVISGAAAAVLLIPELTAAIRLFTGRRYGLVRPAAVFFLFALTCVIFTLVFAVVQILRAERDLQAAAQGDDRVAPSVLTQPDIHQALRDGERLTLARRMRASPYWFYLSLACLCLGLAAPMVAFFGEGAVYLALPHASGWILSWIFNQHGALMFVPPPRLTPFEWLLVLIPAAVALVMCLVVIWDWLSTKRQVICADDRGITVQRFLRRKSFVPWDDIRHLVPDRFNATDEATYWLRGANHGTILDLGLGTSMTKDGKARRPVYEAENGTEAYEANIDQLLATVTVRAHVPLRTWAFGYYGQSKTQEAAPLGLTADEVIAMPQASTLWQPSAAAIAQAASSTDSITLCAATPLHALIRRAAIFGIAIATPVLVLGVFLLAFSGWSMSKTFPGLQGMQGVISVTAMAGALFIGGIAVAAQSHRNTNPAITADGAGLLAQGYNKEKLLFIGWKDVRVWAIAQPDPGASQSITYAVYTDVDTMTWTEPAHAKLVWQRVLGDHHEAYRAAAEKLHATIAARTGFSLHVIPPR